MNYAKARLLTGVTGVGFWTVISTLLLLFPQLLTSVLLSVTKLSQQLLAAALFIGLWVLIMMPFDVVGGYWLPTKFKRSTQPFSVFLVNWFSASVKQGIILFLGLASLVLWTYQLGTLGYLVAFWVNSLVLVLAQPLLFQWIGGIKQSKRDATPLLESPLVNLIVYEHEDVGATGGLSFGGSKPTLFLPKKWMEILKTEQLALWVKRKAAIVASGLYPAGLGRALLFSGLGWLLCWWAIHPTGQAFSEHLMMIFSYTLWCFLGTLILPSLSKTAIFSADKQVVTAENKADFIALMTQLDHWQDDEPSRSVWIERIFHPLASVESRTLALAEGNYSDKSSSIGLFEGWNIARTSLYLSWAGFSLLHRSVHCNVGRPQLWVLLPTE
ncbi:MAG: hypothetical protein H2174_07135 [Vampirovibrio sp.]|nr:hypothetical protein [Vampirovibrio sp.]